MMAELIDRKRLKAEMKDLLRTAQVSPKAMVALYMALVAALELTSVLSGESGIVTTFISIFASLLIVVLNSGFVLYCMAIRRGERAEFLTLFDGVSFSGKLIALNLLTQLFISLWSMLFFFPGIVAAYRYRFALYNLYENPSIGVFEALEMSKRQTLGYKMQLFTLDMSYLGWLLLAAVPAILQGTTLYQETLPMTIAYMGGALATTSVFSLFAAMPGWAWALITSLWSLVVSLFYVATYQCTELGYFEIAKGTSGVGQGTSSQSRNNGPDHLGGF